MREISKKISWEVTKKIFIPVIIFICGISFYIFFKIKIAPNISDALKLSLKKGMATFFVLSAAFILHRFISAVLVWYKENFAKKTKTSLDEKLIPIFRRTIVIIIWVVSFLIVLPFYGVNISALVAALGVSSLAIALAAQDTIANIIAGFLIMVDAPFSVGDRIKIPSGETVTVLDIGVRRSKFLGEDNAIIIVPNVDLSKSRIINYTYSGKMPV